MRNRPSVSDHRRGSVRTLVALTTTVALAACGTAPTSSPSGSGSPPASPEPPSVPPGSSLTIDWEPFALPLDATDADIDGIDGGPAGGLLLVQRLIQMPDLTEVTQTTVLVPDLLGFHVATERAPFGWVVLAALPDRYLAFEPAGEGAAPVWSSEDGGSWERVAAPGMIRNPMSAAVAGGAVVVCGQAPEDMACVVSRDGGSTWRRAEADAVVWWEQIQARGAGFVGLGWDEAGLPRILESRDGAAWSVLPADPRIAGLSGQWALGIGSVGSTATFRATEQGDRRRPGEVRGVLFASLDLRTWNRLALPSSTAMTYDLVPFAGGLVAFGIRLENQSFGVVSALLSADGLSWASATVPDVFDRAEVGVAVVGRLIVAVAQTAGGVEIVTGRIVEVANPDPSRPPFEPLPTPVPEPVGAPRPLAWEVVGTFDGRAHAAASNGDRLVIVGSDASTGSAAVWWLRDGRSWTRAFDPEGGESARMEAVAAWGEGFVASGTDWSDDWESATAAFWWSDDGIHWLRAPTTPDHELGGSNVGAPDLGVTGLAAGTDGLVAVGSTATRGVVFASADGRTWRRVAELEGNPDGVFPSGDGFLALGQAGSEHYPGGGAVWSSRDGSTWSDAVVLDGGPLFGASAGRIDGADRTILVGAGPGAWVSTDGIAWTWAPDQTTLTAGSMRVVTAEPGGFTAAGIDTCRPGVSCIVAWRTTDGRAWSRVPLPLAQESDQVAATIWHDGRAWIVGFGEQRGANAMAGAVVWVGHAD